MVSNIDLAPTFEALAGRRPAGLPLGAVPGARRCASPPVPPTTTCSTSTPGRPRSGAATRTAGTSGASIDVIPSYVAVRSREALLVRLDLDPSWEGVEVAWEFYDYRDAPYERTNTFADPDKRDEVRRLRRRLGASCPAGRPAATHRCPSVPQPDPHVTRSGHFRTILTHLQQPHGSDDRQ